MNKEQTSIVIDIISLGIIMTLCFIAISQIPALEPMIGGLVIVILVLSVLGIIVTGGLIYANVQDLNEQRDDNKNE